MRIIREPDRTEGPVTLMASLLDVAANRALAVQQRASAKDFVDIDASLQSGISLPEILGVARTVFGSGFNPVLTLKALTFFEEGDLDTVPQSVRENLHSAVKAACLDNIRELRPRECPGVAEDVFAMCPDRSMMSLVDVARRVVWFKPSQETLKDEVFFLNHVMIHGFAEDIMEMRRHFDDDALRNALRNAHPGIWDARSWTWWHVILDLEPVPPLPVRFSEVNEDLQGHGGAAERACRTSHQQDLKPWGLFGHGLRQRVGDNAERVSFPGGVNFLQRRVRAGTARPTSASGLALNLPEMSSG